MKTISQDKKQYERRNLNIKKKEKFPDPLVNLNSHFHRDLKLYQLIQQLIQACMQKIVYHIM